MVWLSCCKNSVNVINDYMVAENTNNFLVVTDNEMPFDIVIYYKQVIKV